MIDSNNKKYWNILKGISILSIVIGHSCSFLVPFVYLYHLAIFFFISGYLYSEEKYGDNPFLYFMNKMKSNWKKYVLFSIFFILIHNILLKLNMISGSKYFFRDFITSIINANLFFCTENMGGALWFVPVFIIASSIFGGIIYFSRKISNNAKAENKLVIKNVLIIAFSLIVGVIGIYLNNNNIYIVFHTQTSLLVLPFYTVGYYMRVGIKDLSKGLRLICFVICFGLLVYFAYYYKLGIELSANLVGSTFLFYPVSFIGIYFCLYLSKIIIKIKYINNYFNILGNYSFEIMASHFLVFKIIDFIYSHIVNINDPTIISMFPYSFAELWLIYIILGASIPAFIFYFINKEKTKKISGHS